jgi:hypothetical protein
MLSSPLGLARGGAQRAVRAGRFPGKESTHFDDRQAHRRNSSRLRGALRDALRSGHSEHVAGSSQERRPARRIGSRGEARCTRAVIAGASEGAGRPRSDGFKPEELEQIAAPIALYPDSLLSQVLMASTYPLQIVEANRWQKANSKLKGDALTAQLEKKDWDASVKSLINFPSVLAQLDEKLDWTQKLGDAVLAQQKELMDAIQRLRTKAVDSGNLKTTSEQKVTVEPTTTTVIVEAANPQVVYVPTYNPTVVYGAWPTPRTRRITTTRRGTWQGPRRSPSPQESPSVPPGATPGAAAAGGRGEIDVDIDKNINVNNNINRDNYKQKANQVSANNKGSQLQNGKGSWQHDPAGRKGVSYRDSATQQKYGASTANTSKAREDFRGRRRSDLARTSSGSRPSPSQGSAGSSSARRDASSGSSASNRGGGGAFEGYGKSSDVQRDSARGQSSRQSSSSAGASRSSSSGASRSSSGGSRSSGGGGRSRGGGGRR